MTIQEKYMKRIDFIVIALTLALITLGLIMLANAKPIVHSPTGNAITTNTSVLFEFEKANIILIDDNPEFSSPDKIYAKDNLIINLKPGTYYWKVAGAFDSEIRNLTIISEVDLRLKDAGEKYELTNGGNTALDVKMYKNNFLTGHAVLLPDESVEAEGDKFIGAQK